MATVVQSICPRCQKTLRIPSEWINQPLRCKHCGQTFQARATVPEPVPPIPGRAATPVVTNNPVPQPRPAPAAVAVPAAAAYHPAQNGNDIFGGINDPDESPLPSTYRRRYAAKNSQRKWIILLSFVLLLIGGGVGGLLAWYSSASHHDNSGTEQASNPARGDTPKDKLKESARDTTPVPLGTQFPRRALIVSVHNYLYANLVHGGTPGESNLNVSTFQRALTNALRIPLPQVLHLSDEAGKGKKRTPLKPVIQETVHKFLMESRAQDRILLFFIGHAVEIENQGYLVPIEGELDNPSTLIPLKWLYDELEHCPARQKVLVLDVARLSPTYGVERPEGGPLSPKFEALLQKPPEGVQVLSACSAGQQSYETDDSPMGLFLSTFYDKLGSTNDKKPSKSTKALEGIIARPTDPFPLERIVESVNKGMAVELKPLKLEQVCKLYGKEKPEGTDYNPKEPLAAVPTLPPLIESPINKKSVALVKEVLEEIGVPAVKVTREDNGLRFDMLPPFQEEQMAKLGAAPAPADSKLRAAVNNARIVLWAIAADTGSLSGPFAKEVAKVKADVGANLSVLRDGYRAPGPGNEETKFKNMVLKDEREVAKILGTLNDTLEMLEAADGDRENESKRWQANYDFMKARVQAQLAYLTEYQSMLGSMRKEFPDRGDVNVNRGWRLASQTQLNGDSAGKKLASASRKTLEKLVKDYPGTPWEVLAKREKLTALGLDWKPSQVIGR